MAKQYYDVYLVADGIGLRYHEEAYKGSTWAVSEKQAINNVRFRHRNKDEPNGGYATRYVGGEYVGTELTWKAEISDGKEKQIENVTVQWIG